MKFTRKQLTPDELELTKADNADTNHWRDYRSEVTGYLSIPKPKPPTSVMGTQTDKINTRDNGTEAASKQDVEVQTMPAVEAEPIRASTSQAYPPSLYAFFARVTEPMCVELRKRLRHGDTKFGVQSKSGNNFKFEALKTKPATILHRLKSSAVPENFQTKSVSWNPSGTQLAVGHCSASPHIEWCRHQGIPVTIWSLAQNILKKGPFHEIPFDSCAVLVKFHPKLGNLLAVGFYSGEIALIDFNGKDKEPQVEDISRFLRKDKKSHTGFSNSEAETGGASRQSTTKSHYEFKHRESFVSVDGSCHAQEITSLIWIHCTQNETKALAKKNPSPFHHFLVTSSVDGYIGLWSIDKYTSRIFLERCYVILASNVPEIFKQGNLYQFSCIKQLGIDALDCCNKEEPTKFICSTTGSFLFTGSLMSDMEMDPELTTSARNMAIYSPEPKFLFREEEYISKIQCSPYHSQIYAYITVFGRMAIRNLKNEYEANLELYLENDKPASIFKWSNRPMMFGIIQKNALFFYDLTIHKSAYVLRIDNDVPFCTLAFNMDDSKYVAVTDKSARLTIWKLPTELAVSEVTEMLQFSNFAEFESNVEVGDNDVGEIDSELSSDEAAEKSADNPLKSTEGSNSDSGSASGLRNKRNKEESTPKVPRSDINSGKKFYQDSRPLGDSNEWKKGYSGTYSQDTVEQILKLCRQNALAPQNMKPIIIPNILSSWSPSPTLEEADIDYSNTSKPRKTGSSHRSSREAEQSEETEMQGLGESPSVSRNTEVDKSVEVSLSHSPRMHKTRSQKNFSDNLYSRSFGIEPTMTSTLAEVQVHSPNSNESDSTINETRLEQVLSEEVVQKGFSDAESLEIDSNPNSSSNAEDTVIEAKSQV